MSWKLVPHTADVAIEAEGVDEGEALAAAGLALTSVMTGQDAPHALGSTQEVTFRIEAPDHESLAVAFLAELLWLSEAEGTLWTGGGVQVQTTDDGLVAVAGGNGVAFNQTSHGDGVEVKAVTYHNLLSARQGDSWRVRVLLDI